MVQVRINGNEEALSWQEWEDRVRDGRIAPDALVRFEPATGDAWVEAGDLEMFTSISDDATRDWRARFKHSDPPWMTALLVGIQIRLWWFAWWTPEVRRFFTGHLTLDATRFYEDGEIWRIFSMGFIHLAFFHAFMNLVWLAYTGWNLERALGRLNLFVLYVVSVAAGSLLSVWGDPVSPSLGASGGVYGLVGASVVFGLARPNLLPDAGRRLFGWALVPYLVLMASSGMNSDDIDNWSHLGGLLGGGLLVLFLDPPQLQRRPAWNRRIQTSVAALVLLVPLVLGLFGPRVTPLWTEAEARAAVRPGLAALANDAVQYAVPAGWVPDSTASGNPGFRSHQAGRSFAIKDKTHPSPVDLTGLHAAFVSKLPEAWTTEGWEPTTVPLLPDEHTDARRAVYTDTDGQARVLVWTGAVRGLHSVETVWEVRLEDEARLRALHERLMATVVWPESADYRTARIDYDFDPTRPRARLAWGRQLAGHGKPQEAAALLQELAEEHPEEEAHWLAWLDLLQWYPGSGEPEAVMDAALAAHPTGSMVGEVCQRLAAAEQPEVAAGLADLAWIALPGERTIKRCRRRLGLVTGLVEGKPYDLTHEPATGKRRTEQAVAARRDHRWTLAEARAHSATLERERGEVIAGLVRALAVGDREEVTRLGVVLHTGSVGSDPTKTLEDLALGSDPERSPPRWIPTAVIGASRISPLYAPPP